jgi:hypothetical protein
MTIKGFSALKARHEDLKLGLDRRLQQFSRTFAQKFGQWVRDRISTGKFNNVTLVPGGASASVGGLCRNDNPTRCTASFQIPKTPDLKRFGFKLIHILQHEGSSSTLRE